MDQQNILEILRKEKGRGRTQGIFIGIGIAFGIVILGVIWVGIGLGVFRYLTTGAVFTNSKVLTSSEADKLSVINDVIEEYYLDEYDENDLKESMYKGYVAGLSDPYSQYYTKKEFSDLMEDNNGTFTGIGVYLNVNQDTQTLEVINPIEGSPAEKVGIEAGDIIVEVDGEDIIGQDSDVVISKIRGEKGTSVNIGVVREGEDEILYFDIVRDTVESVTVTSKMLENDIGYLSLSEFAEVSYDQFRLQLNSLKEQGMKALIFDLRSNTGGDFDIAVKIADKFCPEGLVVYIEDKDGNREEYTSDADKLGLPLVVLTNGYSASSSEIVTGAIKDYGVGTIMGTTTYGKGVVQRVLPLGDGSGMKVTIAKYYTPNGYNIHGVGIQPDIEVEWDADKYKEDGTDNQLEEAVKYLTKELKAAR
ncbi:MAG: S41 family peptidase [Lachnospiraceae bacterium]|nr:S41 family peptidase [Lachnospiraceae bacterium]